MKQLIIFATFILFAATLCSQSSSTSTNSNTAPAGAHIGWDNAINAPLWINQNNQNRMIFNAQTSWTGLDGESETNVNHITIPQVGTPAETVPAWSMLHLWEGLDLMPIQS